MKYNVIIIGAGSAGAIIASRLSEDPNRTVLLLEAGADYPVFEDMPDPVRFTYGHDLNLIPKTFGYNSPYSWNFLAKATPEAAPILVPRGKLVGGSSAINSHVFLRGIPDDYNHWAELGNDEWSFEKLLPYFCRLESDSDINNSYHGQDGPIVARRFKKEEWNHDQAAVYEAWREVDFPDCLDFNEPNATGVGAVPFNNPGGVRISTAIGYLNPARQRVNLTIRPDTLVQRILLKQKRAVGVVVESDGQLFDIEADEVILSAGAVGSPQLLLLSGIGTEEKLKKHDIDVYHELPGVGENLRDHPSVGVKYRLHEDKIVDPLSPKQQVGLRYTAHDSNLRDDMLILPQSGISEEIYKIHYEKRDIFGMGCILNLAKSSGSLYLGSADPALQPIIDFNYLRDDFDIYRLREAVQVCLELGEGDLLHPLVKERVSPLDEDLVSDKTLNDWLLRTVATAHHISGTCKMGPQSDSMAVVDQYGKVYGIDGLRIVDGSIMPDCIRANTNVTIMAIGERIAEFIRDGK